jgi:HEAT repeat protein
MFLLTATLAAALAAPAPADDPNAFLGRTSQEWIKDLNGGEAVEKRRSAAFALGQIGAELSRTGPDGKRRGDARQVAQVVRPLIGVMRDKEAGVREAAAAALADVFMAMGDSAGAYWPEAGAGLQKALKDGDARVRRSAACALGALGRDALAARDALVAALDDDAAGVRQNAAWALGRLGPDAGDAAVDKLRGLLKDRDSLVRRDAAGALGAIGAPAGDDAQATPLTRAAAAALLERLPDEKDGVVRRTALQALSRVAGPEDRGSANVLTAILDDPAADEESRWDAAFVLASMGGPDGAKGLPYLRKALQSSDTQLQEQAAVAVARLGADGRAAIEDLGQVVANATDSRARRNAAVALGSIAKQFHDSKTPLPKREFAAVVPALGAALRPPANDPDPKGTEELRALAAEALAFIGWDINRAALPTVLDILADSKDSALLRQRCVWCLFNQNPLDKGAITVLTATLDETSRADNAPMVRYDAARLLANQLRERTPDKATDVLLEMLADDGLSVFDKTDIKGGVGGEARTGTTAVQSRAGGKGRFMAAQGLGWMGKKANRPDVIKALTDAAAEKDDPMLNKYATEALTAIRK